VGRVILAAVAVLALLSPGTAAAAAACTWTSEELPNTDAGAVRGSAPGGYLVGNERLDGWPVPVVWHNKVPALRPTPTGSYAQAEAVNSRGVITGFIQSKTGPDGMRAFRNSGSGYQVLPSPAGLDAWGHRINTAGDILGSLNDGNTWQTVLWPADAPGTYRVIEAGYSVAGFDDSRRVIFRDGRILSPDGSVARVAGGPTMRVEEFADGRLIGGIETTLPNAKRREWTMTGEFVREYPGDLAIGFSRNGLLASWRNVGGVFMNVGLSRDGVDLGWAPSTFIEGITDRDELYGGFSEPIVWTCAT
jgi:hypothetical protein